MEIKFHFPKERLAALIYSQPGAGKSVSLTTLLKVPNLKVRILSLEDNCLPAIRDGLRIHGIESLEEGQLTIAEVKGNGINATSKFMDQTDDSSYQSAVAKLLNFTGFDVATGNEVKLGNALSWDSDTILCVDGLTMLQYACYNRGKVKSEANNTGKDPRAAFYAGQDALIGYIYQLLQNSKTNVVVLAHETQSDDVAVNKHKGLLKIHPQLGTRSIVSSFLGRFNVVLYAKQNRQTRKFVWSGDELDTMTVVRNVTLEGNPYQGKPVTINNLPADFSWEGYNWF